MATDWSKLTVVDLRAELKKRGLSHAGKKADLVQRMAEAELEDAAADPTDSPQPAELTISVEPQDSEPITRSPIRGSVPVGEETQQRAGSQDVEAIALELPKAVETAIDQDATSRTTLVQEETLSAECVAAATTEPTPSAPEIAQDFRERKRRSRSPAPSQVPASKRQRADDTAGETISVAMIDQDSLMSNMNTTEDVSIAGIGQTEPSALAQASSPVQDKASMDTHGDSAVQVDDAKEPGQVDHVAEVAMDVDQQLPNEASFIEESSDIEPATHPATPAIYIKNFMRPLRENALRDHLAELATPKDTAFNPDIVVDFYLDPIRSHSFAKFSSTSAACRVRAALHGKIWPNERNRKELWVDFIPDDKMSEWIDREQAGRDGRGNLNRWEVNYAADGEGGIIAELVEGGGPDQVAPSRPKISSLPDHQLPAPAGPAKTSVGIAGAPLGPRGRNNVYRPVANTGQGDGFKSTRSMPSLQYRPVSSELAQRRLDRMRSYYSKDSHRDMGRKDEINRYTFENFDSFVDRGKEVFIGIRPPHRDQERRRPGGGPSYAPRPRSDRPFRGRDPPRRDAPRSRLNGAPLPSFKDTRFDNRYGRREDFRKNRF